MVHTTAPNDGKLTPTYVCTYTYIRLSTCRQSDLAPLWFPVATRKSSMDQALWVNGQPPYQLHSSTLNRSHRPQESRRWKNGAGSSQLAVLSASSIWYDGVKCALLGTGKALRFKATLTLQKRFCHKG